MTDREAAGSDAAFLRKLLGFIEHDYLEALLNDALDVLVARAGARETVLEVMGDDGTGDGPHVVGRGCTGERLTEISSFVSRGIMAEAIATGRTVVTANAAEDPRFLELESVRRHKLEAVLCVPVGRDLPLGVAYLQGSETADDFRPFDDALRRDVELFAKALGGALERIVHRPGRSSVPPRAAGEAQDPFSTIRGRSHAIRSVVDRLRLAGPLDIHVLFTGPSGAGKTLVANAVHQASRRRSGPFVEINCATLQDALLENELFGAEPGAHSAVPRAGVKGKVEAAERGTLFLDEVAELSVGAQAKLLQLLQSKTYHRLGGVTVKQADVRVLAATNVDLGAAVAAKKFREDLFYRLQVLEIRLPSLAERAEDLIPLATDFLRQTTARHGLPHKSLAPSAMRAIRSAEWPGNVRQLANRIESATIHAHLRGSDWIEGRDVFPDDSRVPTGAAETLQEATREFHRKHLLMALESTDWNVNEAARVLDVSRSHLYHLIRALDLKKE
jgi:Nif-specific regulatory protein